MFFYFSTLLLAASFEPAALCMMAPRRAILQFYSILPVHNPFLVGFLQKDRIFVHSIPIQAIRGGIDALLQYFSFRKGGTARILHFCRFFCIFEREGSLRH